MLIFLQKLSERHGEDRQRKKSKISPITITTMEYITAWNKFKVCTSSNPIEPNYAICKYTTQDKILTTFKMLLLNIPYQTRYSPNRWKINWILYFEKP